MLLNITCVHRRLYRVLDVASRRAIGGFESSYRYLQVNFSICRCCQGVPFKLNPLQSTWALLTFYIRSCLCSDYLANLNNIRVLRATSTLQEIIPQISILHGRRRSLRSTVYCSSVLDPLTQPLHTRDRKVSDIFNDNAGLQYASK